MVLARRKLESNTDRAASVNIGNVVTQADDTCCDLSQQVSSYTCCLYYTVYLLATQDDLSWVADWITHRNYVNWANYVNWEGPAQNDRSGSAAIVSDANI